MTWREITNDQTRTVFRLTCAGLAVRWWSRADAAAAAPATTVPKTSLTYTEREAIIGVGDQTISIGPSDAIAQDGAVRVRLASRGDMADAHDPRRIFGRLGSRGSRRRANLITTIPHASIIAAGVVEVNRDVSGWGPFPRLIHIEQESIWVTGAAGTGTTIDPYRFTVSARSAAASRVDAHLVDASQGWHPEVTSDVVNWLGRHAVLEIAECYEDGSTSAWAEVVRGFIAKSPEIGEHGSVVELDLAPWTTLLSGPIGAAVANGPRAETGFNPGWHYSDGEHGLVVEMVQEFRQNDLWSATCDSQVNGNAFVTLANAANAALFDSAFAVSAARSGDCRKGAASAMLRA